jgi:hypothetical protein
MHLIARLLTPAQPNQTRACQEHPNFWMYPCG